MPGYLKQYLSDKRLLVNAYLESTLRSREKDSPASLLEAMRYALFAQGKRLRPLLVIMAAGSMRRTRYRCTPRGRRR